MAVPVWLWQVGGFGEGHEREGRKPLPPTPSPQRRGGEEKTPFCLLPLSASGRGLGGGVLMPLERHAPLLGLLFRLAVQRRTALVLGPGELGIHQRLAARARPFPLVEAGEDVLQVVERLGVFVLVMIVDRVHPQELPARLLPLLVEPVTIAQRVVRPGAELLVQ